MIRKANSLVTLENSLKILNSVSSEMGFVSSIRKDNETFSLTSRNCILHKVAVSNQDIISHGFHDRIIQKTLDGKANVNVELKECIASGDNYSRHVITNKIPESELADL
jgi:predicted ArsR family transcriptional regulator